DDVTSLAPLLPWWKFFHNGRLRSLLQCRELAFFCFPLLQRKDFVCNGRLLSFGEVAALEVHADDVLDERALPVPLGELRGYPQFSAGSESVLSVDYSSLVLLNWDR